LAINVDKKYEQLLIPSKPAICGIIQVTR